MELTVLNDDIAEIEQEFELQPLSQDMLAMVGGGEGVVMTT